MELTLVTIATADPERRFSQRELFQELSSRRKLSGRERALYRTFLLNSSIERRAFSLSSLDELLSDDPDTHAARYHSGIVSLSTRALDKVLAQARLRPELVRCLATATCTGYLCPGISSYLMEHAKLAADTAALDLGGMGCGAAIPAIRAVCDHLTRLGAGWGAAVCAEICSSIVAWEDHPELILSNSIFADGAAACAITAEPGARGLRILDFRSETLPEFRDRLRLRHDRGKMKNVLSRDVPRIAGTLIGRLCRDLCARHGLKTGDIDAWALHPGGMNVLDNLRDALSLREKDLAPSRRMLRLHGNLSSPSVLYVLKELMARPQRTGCRIIACSFGAGFSAHACLLSPR